MLTQSPRDQKCFPVNPLLHTQRLAVNLDRRFPFRDPTTSATLNFGGILNTQWMWSGIACPSMISPFAGNNGQNRPDPLARPTVQNLLAVLRNEHNVVLTLPLHVG